MAPTKSVAAEEPDEYPSLTLVFKDGPNSGQTSQFKPGSKIRVGRILKGNTLSIKDAGVSSKHLLIQVQAESDLVWKGWTITDLGSSNGTFLNSQMLEPSQPVLLSEGDVIKIGEQTSIIVKFEVSNVESEANSTTQRRNPRRRAARNQVGDLGVIQEGSELEVRNISTLKEKEIGGSNRAPEFVNHVAEIDVKDKSIGKISLRRTRRSTKQEEVKSSFVKGAEKTENTVETEAGRMGTAGEVIGGCSRASNLVNRVAEVEMKTESIPQISLRRTRRSTKQQNLKPSFKEDAEKIQKVVDLEAGRMVTVEEEEEDDEEEIDGCSRISELGNEVSEVEVKNGSMGKISLRRTRRSTKQDKLKSNIKEDGEKAENVGIRITRNSKNKLLDMNKDRDNDLRASNVEGEKGWDLKRTRSSKMEDLDVVERRSKGKESAKSNEEGKMGPVSDVVEEERNGERDPLDLEKTTLGEWLEHLEEFLPNHIIQKTDEMICDMRQKAGRLQEFLVQQKNGKGKEV